MNHRSLFLSLAYRGRVRSLRRDYHVLEGSDHYVLLSPSATAGGNYSVVKKATVAYLLQRVGGKRSVTSADVWAACKRSRLLSERFAVLHALYVLVAIKAATIVKFGSPLFFNVRKRAA